MAKAAKVTPAPIEGEAPTAVEAQEQPKPVSLAKRIQSRKAPVEPIAAVVDEDPNEGPPIAEPVKADAVVLQAGKENLSLQECNAIAKRQNRQMKDSDIITNAEIRQLLRGRRPLRAVPK
jgi:hypothetical protein